MTVMIAEDMTGGDMTVGVIIAVTTIMTDVDIVVAEALSIGRSFKPVTARALF
ncbi:MAG: hypothetical protein DHS20C05_19720 [Hyphococcus sp.]|nr:MAG: hypothetical protein DHS20C05_19720 [Marinicaulis sp.]